VLAESKESAYITGSPQLPAARMKGAEIGAMQLS
jgi:hypothetical protein